jgi:hypothetical protein
MRNRIPEGLFVVGLLGVASCGDNVNEVGYEDAGAGGSGHAAGGILNLGGQIYAIMPLNTGGRGGASTGGARNTGGQVYAIMPLGGAVSTGGTMVIYPVMPLPTGGGTASTGGTRNTGGVRNTGGQVYAIMPLGGAVSTGGTMVIYPVMPLNPGGGTASTGGNVARAAEVTSTAAPGAEDDWWRAAEAALRST